MDKQVTKEQIGSIVALLVAGKVPFEDAQAFIDKYKESPSAKTRKRRRKLPQGDYLVNVRDDVPVFEELQELFPDYCHPTWDKLDYKLMTNRTCLDKHGEPMPETGEMVLFLHCFQEPRNFEDVIARTQAAGDRPATLRQALAFKEQYAEQLKGKIVVILGTYVDDHADGGRRLVPVMEGQSLSFLPYSNGAPKEAWFLIIRND